MKFHPNDLAVASNRFAPDRDAPGWMKPGTVVTIREVTAWTDGRPYGHHKGPDCHGVRVSFFTYHGGEFHCACMFDHIPRRQQKQKAKRRRPLTLSTG